MICDRDDDGGVENVNEIPACVADDNETGSGPERD